MKKQLFAALALLLALAGAPQAQTAPALVSFTNAQLPDFGGTSITVANVRNPVLQVIQAISDSTIPFGGVINTSATAQLGGIYVSGSSAMGLVSATASGTTVLNFGTGNAFTLTLTNNATISATNCPAGYIERRVRVTQSPSISYTLAFPSPTLWSYGASPTIAPSTSSVNTFLLTSQNQCTSLEGYWTGAFMQ